MDVRDALDDLSARLSALPAPATPSPRQALDAFLEHAAEVATYEDGRVQDDWVTCETSVVDDPRSWYPEETRPVPGSLLVSFGRDISVADEDDDFLEHAGVGCSLVFAPATAAAFRAPVEVVAPAGARLADPDDPDEPEGVGSWPGYVTTLDAFRAGVEAALGDLLDEPPLAVQVDGNVPTQPTRASLARPAGAPVKLVLERSHLNDGWATTELDTQLRERRIGSVDPLDTSRALDVLVEFCERPLDVGDAQIEQDELVLTYESPWPGMPDAPETVQFARHVVLRGTDGEEEWVRIGFALEFTAGESFPEFPALDTVRAPAASSPNPESRPEHDDEHVASSPADVRVVATATPIGPFLERRADSVRWATVV